MSESEVRQWISNLTDEQRERVAYWWHAPWRARNDQLPPSGNWRLWFILAGRGWGKTRTGAETVRKYAEDGIYGRFHLIAPTAADARDVMVEGESGLLSVCPRWNRPIYEPSKRRITWGNGAMAMLFSADEPDRLRGPQCEFVWGDEPRSWPYVATWDNAMLGLRLGDNPRAMVTTTPGRTPLIRKLLATPGAHITKGSTYDNRANLAPAFFEHIARQYEGTMLGRQELYAELINDVPGALFKRIDIENARVKEAPSLRRIVVAIDPAITSTEGANETGIVVAGVGQDGQGYVLDDVTLRASPDGWARRAIAAYYSHEADRIVYEANQGGEMVGNTLKVVDPTVPLTAVHASRGKQTRAEPVAVLYEQGRVHHVGAFQALEDQLCSWVPGDESPDRLDALVWALTELMLGPSRDVKSVANPFYSSV